LIRRIASNWQRQPCWRVLDTCFSDGQIFFDTWERWRQDLLPPRVLLMRSNSSPPASSESGNQPWCRS